MTSIVSLPTSDHYEHEAEASIIY